MSGKIRRREKPLKTFGISGWRPPAALHVATTNPSGSGGDANLVAGTVITRHRAHGVSAMSVVIAGRSRVVAVGIGAGEVRISRVNGIMPVVIMIGVGAVPAPVVMDERGMIPLVAGILATDHDTLTGIAQCPHIGGVDLGNVPFQRRG